MDAGLWQRTNDRRTLRSAGASQSRAADGRRELPLSSELTEAGRTVLRDDLVRRWLSFANSAWLTLLLTFTQEYSIPLGTVKARMRLGLLHLKQALAHVGV